MTDSQYQPSAPNTDDCVSKIIEASSLEKSGQIEQAIAIYQEVLELDRGGNYGAVAEKALANLQKSVSASTTTTTESKASWWEKLSLRWKVTGIAITISTLPLLLIGSTAYYFADKSITQQIIKDEEIQTMDLQDKVNRFMKERYGDIKVMANLDILTNPAATPEQKAAALERMKASLSVYDSIGIFDLQGEPIAQTKEGKKLGNHLNRSYIQEALKVNGAIISQPAISTTSGSFSIYAASTIKDKNTGKPIGLIRARVPVKALEEVIQNYKTADKQYYLLNEAGEVFLGPEGEYVNKRNSSGQEVTDDSQYEYESVSLDYIFSGLQSLENVEQVSTTIATNNNKNTSQLLSLSPSTQLEGLPELNWQAALAFDTEAAFASQQQLRFTIILGTAIVAVIVGVISSILANRATRPIIDSAETVKKLGQGELDVRTDIQGADELADLGSNINLMAEQLQGLLKKQEAEAWKQRQEKETLQTGVMNLLLDVEGAQKGDLTVQAKMSEGAIGSIADAFNATISRLRKLLEQVQTVSTEVGQLSQTGENSVRQLSDAAVMQAEEINQALSNIAEINESVENVAKFAQEAAQIAHEGLIQAKEGDSAMDMTVESIEKIRTTVAGTSKKAKQLAESSQEIAQIVDIISGISEKTNLLAFNASVEAARAGEHGEGFRIVAEEVRRLADKITESTKDIQQLVSTIQQDTTSVLQGMETSTTEVVTGSELVRKTKQTLQSLAGTSEKIDTYLQSISSSTIEQTNTSRQVNEKITGIATIARNNSTEAQDVVKSLRTLVQEAETLQLSVSQFKLKA